MEAPQTWEELFAPLADYRGTSAICAHCQGCQGSLVSSFQHSGSPLLPGLLGPGCWQSFVLENRKILTWSVCICMSSDSRLMTNGDALSTEHECMAVEQAMANRDGESCMLQRPLTLFSSQISSCKYVVVAACSSVCCLVSATEAGIAFREAKCTSSTSSRANGQASSRRTSWSSCLRVGMHEPSLKSPVRTGLALGVGMRGSKTSL